MSLFSLYFYALFFVVLGISALLLKIFPQNRIRQKIILLIASLIFIAFASWKCVIIIILVQSLFLCD